MYLEVITTESQTTLAFNVIQKLRKTEHPTVKKIDGNHN
jgi:hypothetical protein